MTLVAAINQRIFDFVHERSNRPLIPGTGSYSTPFRGSLFGHTDAVAVQTELASRSVDALLLGTNPCVPRSLEQILSGTGAGDFGDFQRQMKSGSYPSLRWDKNGNSSPDWNPIQEPTPTWKVYRDALASVFDVGAVTMANFLPWGSQDAKSLLDQLGSERPAVLRRILEFADYLNVEIVAALRPRLLIVPFSLGKNRGLAPSGLALHTSRNVEDHRLQTAEGTVTFFTAISERGGTSVPTLHARHPASLRLSADTRQRLRDEMVKALTKIIAPSPTAGGRTKSKRGRH